MKRPLPTRLVPLADDPAWYKDAVIYEVRTRSYFDSNDDGVGDLRGLASKLDYLQDLGVTALWLLPFYPSPGRDDGYDIADYHGVHPEVGTLDDFEYLLAEAHRRGLRVITELVLNHTSDLHPWFQRARRAPVGSPEREFYVWSETPDKFKGARIIFKDFETSNWAWDGVAGAYYWHRFYAHQPDLNFENPVVQEALLEVVDFWLGKGVDGLRLDAVPYLYEEEGTSSENLPKTHAFLRKLRAHVDAKFKNRMLLAEANQWPEDAAAYFGAGDECHMNFHFPLMPRMFMAIHMEDRLPLVDIFAQTPEVHPSCQWALFLRNHDELTLEMVTDEERDYMYRAYGQEGAMRINLGIRRRLAPLVENSRRKMELLHGLLLSLPGTPVLYYGDEIGMGDNVYLGDRNGVRTPMQWTMDRNAGFSRATPQRLILPVIIDPEYHYESLNVENQQGNPTSLLWWMKRIIALRKRFPAFGRGSIEFLSPQNPRILAYVRNLGGASPVLVVANLSRFVQCVELDLSKYAGTTPVELFGKTRFPLVGTSPYFMTLGPHGFYWFELALPKAEDERVSLPMAVSPSIASASLDGVLYGDERPLLEDSLRSFLETRAWMTQRQRVLRAVRLDEVYPLGESGGRPLFLLFVRTEYVDGDSDLCAVPLAFQRGEGDVPPTARIATLALKGTDVSDGRGILFDALEEPGAARAFLDVLTKGARVVGSDHDLIVTTTGTAPPDAADLTPDPKKLGLERDDTVVRYGDRLVLRLFRHVPEGTSPELELGRFFANRGSDLAPPLLGTVELSAGRSAPLTVGAVQGYVANGGTGWEITTQELARYFERALARGPSDAPPPPPPTASLLALAAEEVPAIVGERIGVYRDTAARFGARVAELHRLLASETSDPELVPEPYTSFYVRSKYQSLRTLTGKVLRLLREHLHELPRQAQTEATHLLTREADILKRFEPLLRAKIDAVRIRVHGDLHLGHAVVAGKTIVFTDFDGVHDMPFAERRRKRSPLVDVASMLCSLEMAAYKTLFDPSRVREGDLAEALPWAQHWHSWTGATFLRAYLEGVAGADLIPHETENVGILLQAFMLQRTLHRLQVLVHDRSATVIPALFAFTRGFP